MSGGIALRLANMPSGEARQTHDPVEERLAPAARRAAQSSGPTACAGTARGAGLARRRPPGSRRRIGAAAGRRSLRPCAGMGLPFLVPPRRRRRPSPGRSNRRRPPGERRRRHPGTATGDGHSRRRPFPNPTTAPKRGGSGHVSRGDPASPPACRHVCRRGRGRGRGLRNVAMRRPAAPTGSPARPEARGTFDGSARAAAARRQPTAPPPRSPRPIDVSRAARRHRSPPPHPRPGRNAARAPGGQRRAGRRAAPAPAGPARATERPAQMAVRRLSST